jgi:uncharacterized protein
VPSPIVRGLLIVIGTLSLVLGIIGIFLPLLPTTPFLLLASACFLRGSERMHRWLLAQGRLGAYIRRYEAGEGIPRRAKILAMLMMWPSLGFSAWFVGRPWLGLVLLAVGVGVTVWIWRLPTTPPAPR